MFHVKHFPEISASIIELNIHAKTVFVNKSLVFTPHPKVPFYLMGSDTGLFPPRGYFFGVEAVFVISISLRS